MKSTASQAEIASESHAGLLPALVGRRRVVGMLAVATGLLLMFFLGRVSVTAPIELNSAFSTLRLDILLQQNRIDRLSQENRLSINALAARMAELHAASTRIDALGERLAQMGQLNLDEFDFSQPAPMGGPADTLSLAAASEDELRHSIDTLSDKLRRQASQIDALQHLMVNRQTESDLTPTGWPVRKGWISSRFGERNDPFTGERARHQGLDFAGTRGSEVLSVASGVVVWSGSRGGYGKTIEVDHGNGFRTRYAHNENLEVAPGEHVTAGQLIAKMGSSGRASAPHVHFEVLKNGNRINPSKFVGQLR